MQCSKAILMRSNLNTNMRIEEQVGQRCHQVTKWHGCQWTEWSKQLSLPGLAVLQYIYIYIRLSFTGGVINLELELRLWNSFFACLNLGIFNWPRRNSKLVQGFLGRLNNKNLLLRFLRMQRSSKFKMCLSISITPEGQAWARGPKIWLHEDRFSKMLNPVITILWGHFQGSTLYSCIIISGQCQSISIKNPIGPKFWKLPPL